MAKWISPVLYLVVLGVVSAGLFTEFISSQTEQFNCEVTCRVNIIGLTTLSVFVAVALFMSKKSKGTHSSSINTLPDKRSFLETNFFTDKRFLHRIIVVNVLAILLLNFIVPFYRLVKDTRINARKFLFESTSIMKQRNYGDCNKMGYGYLERIISSIPEPDIFPTMRYSDFNHYPHVLFSDSRIHYDERLLVGISLHENETQEVEITKATLKSIETDPPQITWTFQTRDNYDLLTGIIIHLDDKPKSQSQVLSVTLYESPINFVVIGQWNVVILGEGLTTMYPISDPIQDFSHNRGTTDFILTIESRDHIPLPNISDITILGVKVNLSGYTVYNREFDNNRFCFAAIKNSFLNEINTKGDTKWQNYLNEVGNIDTVR